MTDRDRNPSSRGQRSGRPDQSSQSGGIRDTASPGEGGSRGSSEGGMRAPSGSDELDGDVSRTGQSGQAGRSGTPGSPSDPGSSGQGNPGGPGNSGTSR